MMVFPLNDRILIRRLQAEDKVGSIHIPEGARERPLEGVVVAVGKGRLDVSGARIPVEVKAGDRVLLGKYAGTEIRIGDVEHVILREDEILGILS